MKIKNSIAPYFGAAMPKREGACIDRVTGEELVTYSTSKVFLEEGWYTLVALKELVERMEQINEINKGRL